jgi:hypothetical protein|nr:MAG TPA: hypothetical protein [Caudoviricetes sp.]
MANVIVKSDERIAYEAQVAESFGCRGNISAEQREQAETIAAKTREICRDNHMNGGY